MALYFPMFVDLSEKNILFAGAGSVNSGRILTMLDFAGSITVVAPEAEPCIGALAEEGLLIWHRRRFDEKDIEGMDMVLAATGHAGTDVRIAGMCRRKGIPVNADSDKERNDFFFPGIARKDPLVVGISDSGENSRMTEEATAYFKRLLKDNR